MKFIKYLLFLIENSIWHPLLKISYCFHMVFLCNPKFSPGNKDKILFALQDRNSLHLTRIYAYMYNLLFQSFSNSSVFTFLSFSKMFLLPKEYFDRIVLLFKNVKYYLYIISNIYFIFKM